MLGKVLYITLTETWIIPDVRETASKNCFTQFFEERNNNGRNQAKQNTRERLDN